MLDGLCRDDGDCEEGKMVVAGNGKRETEVVDSQRLRPKFLSCATESHSAFLCA